MREDNCIDVNTNSTNDIATENALPDTMSKELGPKTMGSSGQRERARGTSSTSKRFTTTAALLTLLATAPGAMAQSCISLAGSTTCSAFNTSSISTDVSLIGNL